MESNKLKELYLLINRINPNLKTAIIVILVGVILGGDLKFYIRDVISESYQQEIREKQIAEDYTETIAPLINQYVQTILSLDKDATNVLLLNYHNTLTSSHGLSYRYLTTITEKRRGIETKNCFRIWRELEYIHYEDEIEKINSNQFLRMDSIEPYAKSFPNITDLLEVSNAKAAAFYPIQGISSPVGMIVILYNKPKDYYLGYYNKVIARQIQPIAALLDYRSMKGLFLQYPKEQFTTEFKKRHEN